MEPTLNQLKYQLQMDAFGDPKCKLPRVSVEELTQFSVLNELELKEDDVDFDPFRYEHAVSADQTGKEEKQHWLDHTPYCTSRHVSRETR